MGLGSKTNSWKHKIIFNSQGKPKNVGNISPQLHDLPNIIVSRSQNPFCGEPSITYGNKPTDGGYLSKYTKTDVNKIVAKYPKAKGLFKKLIGTNEFTHQISFNTRWCLWLKGVPANRWLNIPPIVKAVKSVEKYRHNSRAKSTRDTIILIYLDK